MKRRIACWLSLSLILLIQFLANPSISRSDEVQKVAILPFAMHAEKDLGFLREGITDMLASRLYWKGKVEVIEKGLVKKALDARPGAIDQAYALAIGRELGADYVLYGSATVFGDSVSLDATMAAVSKEQEPVTVFTQTKGMESVIPEINKFAQQVNDKIFSRNLYAGTSPQPAPQQPLSQPQFVASQPVVSQPAPGSQDGRVSSLNPQFKKFNQVDVQGDSFWKSKPVRAEINGMDIGDVDGDGQNEVVLVQGTEITVNRYRDGNLANLAAYRSSDRNPFISADVADTDGDGRAEIYASRVSGVFVSSVVLVMDGRRLKPRVENSPWFFRVMDWPGRGRILVGQEKRPGSIGGGFLVQNYFSDGIFALKWNGSKYVKAEEAPLLDIDSVYIYNFAIADLGGDPGLEIAMIDTNGKLRVLDQNGEELYKSAERYGGTLNYIVPNPVDDRFGTPRGSARINKEDYLYIPARMLITDLDRDGRKEIIVNQNKSVTGDMLERFRYFSDGKIVSLSWNGLSLNPNWESRKLPGCLSDFQVKDLENTGEPSLVAAVIQSQGASAFKDARSIVVSYRLSYDENAKGKVSQN